MNNFDLHMHSCNSSDGEFTPKQLIEMGSDVGLKYMALCDHDEVCGVPEMQKYGEKAGIHVIPGIECSTLLEGQDVHLLGYGIDIENEYFKHLGEYTRKLSQEAFHTRVEKLRNKYGLEIDEEQVLRDSHGQNPWFLMLTQIFNNPEYQSIPDFKEYIPGGKRSDPAPVNFFWDRCQKGSDLYVYVANPDFCESVKKIHEAGGIAVVAHPFKTFYKNDDLLQKALDAGIDGMEVFSNYHEEKHREFYKKFAEDHNLLITCGSDFHGEKKPSIKMGDYGLEEDGSQYLETFLKCLDK